MRNSKGSVSALTLSRCDVGALRKHCWGAIGAEELATKGFRVRHLTNKAEDHTLSTLKLA